MNHNIKWLNYHFESKIEEFLDIFYWAHNRFVKKHLNFFEKIRDADV